VATCNVLIDRAFQIFSGQSGLNDRLAAIPLLSPLSPISSILKLSAPIDAYEKSASVRYPVARIYCERLKNTLMEKHRSVSGTALLVVEIRVSGARPEELDEQLNSYVEAACQVLEATRGSWTEIATYPGAYEVKFQAMKPGGKQFTKSAHIEFELYISR